MGPEDAACWLADVAAVSDLLSAGVARQTIRRRLSGKRWQQPSPRVVCRTTGTLTAHQWMLVALAHGGPGAMISHATAGAFWGFDATTGAATGPVHVTVPHGRRRPSTVEIQVHQSVRPCEPRLVEDLLVTPPARTAVDMALCLTSATSVAAHLGRVMQRGRVSLEQLADELDQARAAGRDCLERRWPTWRSVRGRPPRHDCCT